MTTQTTIQKTSVTTLAWAWNNLTDPRKLRTDAQHIVAAKAARAVMAEIKTRGVPQFWESGSIRQVFVAPNVRLQLPVDANHAY